MNTNAKLHKGETMRQANVWRRCRLQQFITSLPLWAEAPGLGAGAWPPYALLHPHTFWKYAVNLPPLKLSMETYSWFRHGLTNLSKAETHSEITFGFLVVTPTIWIMCTDGITSAKPVAHQRQHLKPILNYTSFNFCKMATGGNRILGQ